MRWINCWESRHRWRREGIFWNYLYSVKICAARIFPFILQQQGKLKKHSRMKIITLYMLVSVCTFHLCLRFGVAAVWLFVRCSFLAAGKRTHIAVGQERRTATRELRKLNFIFSSILFRRGRRTMKRNTKESRQVKCNNISSSMHIHIHRWIPPCLSNIYFRLHLASTNYAMKRTSPVNSRLHLSLLLVMA